MSGSIPAHSVFSSPLVETGWLSEHLSDPDLRILDCSVFIQYREKATPLFVSGKDQWQQAHIPGSQFIDVINELSDPRQSLNMMMPPVDDFMEIMAGYGIGSGTKVVLYDALNNIWAARVWWMF